MKRLWHWLSGRPGIQRHVVSEYAAEERRILADWYADGSHDVLPDVDDFWREVALGYLERMFALPDAEVQR